MLTDPFYIPGAKYSESCTGVRDFAYGASYVASGLALVSLLLDAGWSIVDSQPGVAIHTRPAWYFQVNDASGPAGEMPPAICLNGIGPGLRRFGVAGVTLHSYDPGETTPNCPGGTGNIRWFEAGGTTIETAGSLVSKINEFNIWVAGLSAIIGDPAAGGSYEFTFISLSPGFENDEASITFGAGHTTTRGGYYTLRSPPLNGIFLECKIETRVTNNSGGFFIYDGVGTIKLCLTITSSVGGSFYMPLMPGDYKFCGSNHQFAIWPREGVTPSRNQHSSLLASLIEPPEEHATGGACPLVIGSNNGDLVTTFDQLRTKMHWPQSLASGQNGVMDDTVYGKGFADGYRLVTMLARGTKNTRTVGLNGQPLVQAPYVAAPANPTSGPEAEIVGKLWDTVITSGSAAIGERMRYDSRTWECFSRSTPVNDVGCDMWALVSAG